MGSAAETGVGMQISEQKSQEGCRVQRLLFGLLPTPAAWASLPSTPSSLRALSLAALTCPQGSPGTSSRRQSPR